MRLSCSSHTYLRDLSGTSGLTSWAQKGPANQTIVSSIVLLPYSLVLVDSVPIYLSESWSEQHTEREGNDCVRPGGTSSTEFCQTSDSFRVTICLR